MFLKTNPRNQGFTLIELLVVVAIIGLLAVIAIVSFRITKAKSRDAQRISDIKNIKTSLEFYNNEQGHYVEAGDCLSDTWITVNGSTDALSQALIGLNLYPAGGAPRDPMTPTQDYEYCHLPSQNKYQLRYTLETNSTAGPKGVQITGP